MQRRQHEADFGALSAPGAATSTSIDVIVVSADDALIATLQQAAGAQHTLWHAPSANAAVELLVGGRCGVLIADMQILSHDAAAILERLQAQFPELVLLATGRREEEGRVAGLISKGSVYRFLHKPVSPARANLFLATAIRRHHELAQTVSPALAGVRQLTATATRMPLPLLGGAILALLATGAIGWYLQRPASAPVTAASVSVTAAPPAPAPAAAVATQPVAATPELLAQAQAAFTAGRLSAPAGDNALDLYRSVVAIEPDNAAALAGVQDVLDALEVAVTQALQARNAQAAVQALALLQKAEPDHPQLPLLNAQLLTLSRSMQPETAPVAKPMTADPAGDAVVRATPNLQLARSRIDAGQLFEPEADSALFYLRAARDQGEDESVNRILATDVGSQLLARTRQAIAADEAEQARTAFAAASAIDREFELGLPDLEQVSRELDTVNTPAPSAIDEQLAAAIMLRERGQLLEPAGSNAFEALQSLAGQFPDSPELRTEQQRLAFTLLEYSRTALAQGDLQRADLLTTRAEDLIPRMAATRSLREQIAAAQQEREAATRIVQAGELKRTREVAASYPPDAERRGTEGWVDVEFTIAPTGATQDLVVRNAEPKDVFEKSALEALSKWRFVPIERNGEVVSQRATLRIRFSLK